MSQNDYQLAGPLSLYERIMLQLSLENLIYRYGYCQVANAVSDNGFAALKAEAALHDDGA